jgi:hypothetical protein
MDEAGPSHGGPGQARSQGTGTAGTTDAASHHTAASYYEDSYSHFGIHEEMCVCRRAYRDTLSPRPHSLAAALPNTG